MEATKTIKAVFNPRPLAEARARNGMTAAEIASRIGRTTGQIYNIEKGWSSPSIETLAAISRVLNISLDTLFIFDDFNDNTDIPIAK